MKKALRFDIQKKCSKTHARLGKIHTAHGVFHTPAFMPVGTQATVKTMTPRALEEAGAEIILSNTYHLYVRPGMEIIGNHKGLHSFMGWDKPILTDSGGFQVFSLSKLRKVTAEGATFNSHFDGRRITFTPESVMKAQEIIGSDIAMVFDECMPYPSEKEAVRKSVHLSVDWAQRSKAAHTLKRQAVFGIVQGGMFLDLRKESLGRTVEIGFDGYALGGVSVGEPTELLYEIVRTFGPALPEDKPRYLMGVGYPLNLLEAVSAGIDMFDCVVPTRFGRNGSAFTRKGIVVVRNGSYARDKKPLDPKCTCYACQNFSRSYLRHLLNCEEVLGAMMVSHHNIHFFLTLMKDIRRSLKEGTFLEFKKQFLRNYDEKAR